MTLNWFTKEEKRFTLLMPYLERAQRIVFPKLKNNQHQVEDLVLTEYIYLFQQALWFNSMMRQLKTRVCKIPTVLLINKLKFSRVQSSAHTWSDVQQHAKQCTSTHVSMYEHMCSIVQAHASLQYSCTEDTCVVFTGTWVTELMYRVHCLHVKHASGTHASQG